MQTAFYSILHFLTDGICAFAMYANFQRSDWFLYILLYDFCAFVLQMPFGALMDRLKDRFPEKAGRLPYCCAAAGGVLTVAGAFIHPVVLGLGNALFHVGGGIGTIGEDRKKGLAGAALGIFVAPGALGLFLGTHFGDLLKDNVWVVVLCAAAAVYAALFIAFGACLKKRAEAPEAAGEAAEEKRPVRDADDAARPVTMTAVLAVFFCFLVVVLRSYAGISVRFTWRSGFTDGLLCTLAVVLGKACGGVLAARFGTFKVMTASLVLAALCYFFSYEPAAGIAALFLFNMTMPVTLYLIADRFRGFEGFSFGLLTVALFLGIVPGFAGLQPILPGQPAGPAICLLSLLLLLTAAMLLRREKK